LSPGELKSITCDVQIVSYGNLELEFNVDAMDSIIELNEDNNNYREISIVLNKQVSENSGNLEFVIILISILIIIGSVLVIQFGPRKINKEFGKIEK